MASRSLAIFGDSAQPAVTAFSHTFTFTTNPDGSVEHTYSWGNAANLQGWNLDQPEDMSAAKEALAKNYAVRIDARGMEPYYREAFDRLNTQENKHPNLIFYDNCKWETLRLRNMAQRVWAEQNWSARK